MGRNAANGNQIGGPATETTTQSCCGEDENLGIAGAAAS